MKRRRGGRALASCNLTKGIEATSNRDNAVYCTRPQAYVSVVLGGAVINGALAAKTLSAFTGNVTPEPPSLGNPTTDPEKVLVLARAIGARLTNSNNNL